MTDVLRTYGDTLGSLGFPMTDAAAKALDALLGPFLDVMNGKLVARNTSSITSPARRPCHRSRSSLR
jgi:hypothetical protein